ncbi:MAG: FAD-dependent oxidoreductase [Lautropia sp.]
MAERSGFSSRLDAAAGVLIDRSRPLSFRFDGERIDAFAGDTITSALVASGRWLMSRSFKYHRPRGPVSFAGHEANTLVQVDAEPNVCADLRPAGTGSDVRPLNVVGRLDRDRAAILGSLGWFLPVGFYYRDFFGPDRIWDRWEKKIRAMAGLGQVGRPAASRRFVQRFVHCDVAVVGGGPAGLAAAAAAAREGADVALFEQQPKLGGALSWGRLRAEASDDQAERDRLAGELSLPPEVTVWTSATVTGIFDDGLLSVIAGDALLKVRARQIVLAHGGIEQLPVFPNNDLPGIALPGGLQRLIRLHGVRPGRRAVVVASDDAAYGAAVELLDAGVEVAALADLRGAIVGPIDLVERLRHAGTRLLDNVSALRGRAAFSGLHVGSLEVSLGGGKPQSIACDLVAASAGTVPAFNLAAQAGAAVRYRSALRNFVVESAVPSLHVVGTLAGVLDLAPAIDHARESGRRAARGEPPVAPDALVAAPDAHADPVRRAPLPAWPIFEAGRGKAFVDLDEDLQPEDLRETVRLGYADMQLLKRFSTVGMGPSQGRHSALATLRIVARQTGSEQSDVGLATPRPPVGEETVAHLATGPEHPVRRTALHDRHLELGAVMMPAGAWLRPAYFGNGRSREQAIADEVEAVRQRAGLFDVGTLGGLLVRGPDAAAFLERMYTGRYATMKPGAVRYALMLDEVGSIYDDGVVACVEPDVFYVTTTSGHSDAIYRSMLKWNARWQLDLDVTNVTSAYCGVNLAGPASRAILSALCPNDDLSQAAFGYMRNRTIAVAGVPAIAMRVGFLGELAYELHLPASRALAVVDHLLEAGRAHGLVPIGVEAQRQLRLEKGHVIVGQDTDGISTPQEANMGWALAADKPFYIGQRSLRVRASQAPTRALVCWQGPAGAQWPVAEGHLVLESDAIVGHVTSVGYSATLGRTIGMAFAAPSAASPGAAITIKGEGGQRLQAEVVAAPFYDLEGARQKR